MTIDEDHIKSDSQFRKPTSMEDYAKASEVQSQLTNPAGTLLYSVQEQTTTIRKGEVVAAFTCKVKIAAEPKAPVTFDEATTELHQALDDPAERQHVLDWLIVEDAWLGKRGPDQERIAKEALCWAAMLLRKNHDYGSSAWKPPVLAPECGANAAIRVRMSDKIERLQNLLKGNSPEIAESINDNIRDLGSYCLLLLTCPPLKPQETSP